MNIEIILDEIFNALRAIGLSISEEAENWITVSIAILIIIGAVIETSKFLLPLFSKLINWLVLQRNVENKCAESGV